ncbi:MAG: non-canonical purine NTP pyrophosphatase, RdgB/HAM1 family [Planctomycetaceae bacterium]|jgi:XTP/dITP diphosphohydrolase|nr:non-canonical purine NTP pyrophosphatase, RdgB/HAM1 family [Planctomycetaceae bacterium]
MAELPPKETSFVAERRLLVLGTHNKKKGIELRELLGPYGFDLRTLADFSEAIEVEETGETFAENALLKATVQAKHLGCWVLGEDSGLAVDALDGAPGVYSARFSGPEATDESNNQLLLEHLADMPLEQRGAHYTCHVVLSDPMGNVRAEWEECCRGRILFGYHGTGGFGYDPLFEIPEYHMTFGQLGYRVKAVLSHRSRAMRAIIPRLITLAAEAWTGELAESAKK